MYKEHEKLAWTPAEAKDKTRHVNVSRNNIPMWENKNSIISKYCIHITYCHQISQTESLVLDFEKIRHSYASRYKIITRDCIHLT